MMKSEWLRPRGSRLSVALLVALTAAACSSSTVPPPRLYVLSPVGSLAAGEHMVAGLPTILVVRTQIPDYLDRPQIVERTGANGLKLIDSDQWAERLSLNISRVVALNLSAMVPADATIVSPERAALVYDYQVVISLDGFELDQSGAANLSGRWAVTNGDGTKELAAAGVSLHQPATQAGIAAEVGAMNRNLATLCRDVAAALKRLKAQGAGK